MIVDTHCHLFKEYYDNLEIVINKMENNIIVVSGTNFETNQEVIKLCNKYDNIYGTIGFHPSELEEFDMENLQFISKNIINPKIIGIGEIGLDYYWQKGNREKQIEIFEKQLNLAKKYEKTVVVHSREALKDTYEILTKPIYKKLKVVLHCYNYDRESAQKFIDRGFMLGIGGLVTFKKVKMLKEVVKEVPLESLLLETDSPFLTPEPYRGKRNEPINVKIIAKEVAKLKKIDMNLVKKITTENFFRQFDLKNNL